MKVTVVTSVYGDYDEPSVPAAQTVPTEFVLVTDRDHLAPTPWRTVFEPRPGIHPRLAAKVAKCRPDLYADAGYFIWMDASMEITAPDFVEWCLSHLDGSIAQIPHPDRNCIEPEASVSAQMGKYANLPVIAQARHYIEERRHPRGWGLWATGLIVYESFAPTLIGDDWLREQMRWTYQDQLSQPYLLRARGIRPSPLPGRLYGHDKFAIRRHRDGS